MDERTPVNTSDFLEEKIKTRPRNRRRIIRRAFEVAMLAMLFGLVSCITMVLVSPILEEKLFPTPTNEVKFTEESAPYTKEEVQPEDMLLEENEKEPGREDLFSDMIYFLKESAASCKSWFVQVDGVSSAVSWLESTNTSSSSASGAIIADNGTEFLVLVERDCLLNADKIEVTFGDNSVAEGYLKGEDIDAGLAVVAVPKGYLGEGTLELCSVAEMVSSNSKSLVGSAVMAIGNPNGVRGSVIYGFITANNVEVNSWDMNYNLITTDMYGVTNPNGFLVNLKGQLIGVLNNDYNTKEASNMITALGINELKKKVERMSNAEEIAVLGVKGTGVTAEAHSAHGIPHGAYVLSVRLDSPAMRAGIQAGDIIIKADDRDISSMYSLSYHLQQQGVGDTVSVVIMRHSQGTYKESTLTIVLGSQN